jgi:hypothetical protein
MKHLLLTALLLAAVALGVWHSRRAELAALRLATAHARSQETELEALRRQTQAAAMDAVDTQELQRLRGLRAELARLRGSIGTLRERASQPPEQLEAKAEQLRQEAALIQARREAKAQSRAAHNSLHQCLALITGLAFHADGSLPRDWNALRTRLGTTGSTNEQLRQLAQMAERGAQPGGLLAQFEILPASSEIRLKRSKPIPSVLVLRELQPRSQPDGGYARYYAWLDGRTEEVTLPDLNFAAWENQQSSPDLTASKASARTP